MADFATDFDGILNAAISDGFRTNDFKPKLVLRGCFGKGRAIGSETRWNRNDLWESSNGALLQHTGCCHFDFRVPGTLHTQTLPALTGRSQPTPPQQPPDC